MQVVDAIASPVGFAREILKLPLYDWHDHVLWDLGFPQKPKSHFSESHHQPPCFPRNSCPSNVFFTLWDSCDLAFEISFLSSRLIPSRQRVASRTYTESTPCMLSLADLTALADQHRTALNASVHEFDIAGRPFPFNSKPALIGVINLSPDSWYRESVCLSVDSALNRGSTLKAQGADLIDVGAESTLAHAARLDTARQKSVLNPVITGLTQAGCLVSAETYSREVAEAALKAGAAVLNLTGTVEADTIYPIAAEHGAAIILCYVQGPHVRDVTDFQLHPDPIPGMLEYFSRQIEAATAVGLDKIILDPGLGFYYRNLQDSSLRVRHQITTFLNTFRLRTLGFPVCHALPHAFEYFGEEVRTAESFFAVLAALGKTDLFRTHEVSKVRAVLEVLQEFPSR